MRRTARYLLLAWGSLFLGGLFFPAFSHSQAPSSSPSRQTSEGEENFPVRKTMVFFRTEGMSEDETSIFYDSLVIYLEGNPYNKRIVEGIPIRGPETLNERASVSFRRACDSWMLVEVKKKENTVQVAYRLYDILYEAFRAESSYEGDLPSARDRATFFWKPVRESLKSLPPLPKDPVFTVHGVPGTTLLGLPGGAKVLNSKGVVQFSSPAPMVHSFRAEKLGYDPLEQQVLLKEKGGDIRLSQKRGTLVNLEFSLWNGQFPSLGAAFFPVPNVFFLKIGVVSYSLGIGPFLADEERFEPFVSYPFATVNFQIGRYFGAPDETVRLYGGIGGSLRIFFSEIRTMLDPVLPMGGYPFIGLEYAPLKANSVFVEYTPTIFYIDASSTGSVSLDSYLQTYYFKNSVVTGIGFDRLWFELLSFRIGYRVRL